MRIALIGPGLMPIPPAGWGAVELVVHELSVRLRRRGHEVLVVNRKDENEAAQLVNEFKPDFVNVHPDHYHRVLPLIDCAKKAITSHYPFLTQLKPDDPYARENIEPIVRARDAHIFALSEGDAASFVRFGAEPGRVHVIPNGVDVEAFRFDARPRFADRSICLGRVNPRKRQVRLQSYDCGIDFAGPVKRRKRRWYRLWKREGFDADAPDYLGEWSREQVRERLTDYANLVLLSKGEGHSLACMEALAAGLGLVISRHATAHLDLSKEFIDVIPDEQIADRKHVCEILRANRAKSVEAREAIRAYARQFDWERAIDRYCAVVSGICAGARADDVAIN